MGDFTRVKSPMKIHGRFYLSKKTPDYKMTHQLFTLFWIISNILTFHFYTFSVICTFYFYIAFEELTFYQKCSIKCVLYSLFYSVICQNDLDFDFSSRSEFWVTLAEWVADLRHLFNLRLFNWRLPAPAVIKNLESSTNTLPA